MILYILLVLTFCSGWRINGDDDNQNMHTCIIWIHNTYSCIYSKWNKLQVNDCQHRHRTPQPLDGSIWLGPRLTNIRHRCNVWFCGAQRKCLICWWFNVKKRTIDHWYGEYVSVSLCLRLWIGTFSVWFVDIAYEIIFGSFYWIYW